MFSYKLKRKSRNVSNSLDVLDKRTAMWKPIFLILPALIIVILFMIIPFITAINDGTHVIPRDVTHGIHRSSNKVFSFESFNSLLGDPQFKTATFNSIVYAIISVPLVIFISLIISSTISTLIRKKLRGFWQTIFFLPYVTSAIAIGLTFAYIFDFDNGLINKLFHVKVPWLIDTRGHSALYAMLIYGVWRGLAFNILIFTTAMLSVNPKLYKSASIDGAGPIKQFFKITLPSIRPTMNFLFTIGLIGAIKVFPLALFSNNSRLAMTYNGSTLLLYVFDKIRESNYELAGAASVMLVVIAISFTVIVKSSTKITSYAIIKIGEKRVQNKIALSTIKK